jgi:hypothetical protein
VSDAVGCAPDLIEEGLTGFTYPVGDVRQMARRLEMLSDQTRKGNKFAPALAAKLRDYSIEKAVSGTLHALITLTERPRRS